MGISAITTGRIKATATTSVRGLPARIVGILLIMSLAVPIAYAVGQVLIAEAVGRQSPDIDVRVMGLTSLGILVFAAVLGFICAKPNPPDTNLARLGDFHDHFDEHRKRMGTPPEDDARYFGVEESSPGDDL